MHDRTAGPRQLIWDLPTRIFHWALALSFAGAYVLSEVDDLRAYHVMFGYTVLGLIVFRLLWGIIGGPHSRFSSFAYGPREAVADVRNLASGRARDHEGHGPAASWSVYLLLALAAATATSGWLHYNHVGGEVLEDLHETLANTSLALIVLHLLGVLVSSMVHRRNVVRPMITGYRGRHGTRTDSPRIATGVALALAVVGFWTWTTLKNQAAQAGARAVALHSDLRAHDDHDDD